MKEKQIEELLWKIRGSSMKIKEERKKKENENNINVIPEVRCP